jgi:hypothetical protein
LEGEDEEREEVLLGEVLRRESEFLLSFGVCARERENGNRAKVKPYPHIMT